ncbi:MAG: hypothetical protein AAES65_19490 [Candidatus Thiodiazotropha sp. (ex. Lucinoma kazani)]
MPLKIGKETSVEGAANLPYRRGNIQLICIRPHTAGACSMVALKQLAILPLPSRMLR